MLLMIESICKACESKNKPCSMPCELWYRCLERGKINSDEFFNEDKQMKIKSIRKITESDISALNNDLNEIRQIRAPILKAFDIYKSNVYYGVISETEEEHAEVMTWYQELCDLKLNAVRDVPEKIKRYM